MSNTDQLQWEARLARPAALAAFAGGLLLLVGTFLRQSVFEDRAGIRPTPDFLLSVNDTPGTLIASSAVQGVAGLCLVLVFYYLFRATISRQPSIPRWFVYLVLVGPVMYAVSQVIGAFDTADVAETFADRDYSFPDADAPDDRDDPDLRECPAIRGELGEDCADELIADNANGLAIGLNLAGSVSVAFLFIMLPLRARRAGLLSPFMGILGVIAGVLLVLPLLPLVPIVIQAFWLGAIGALFLGNWPGGRGPAWESGEADPWPTPAERRGLVGPDAAEGADEKAAEEEEQVSEPEPVPERPSSRKRKRKRR